MSNSPESEKPQKPSLLQIVFSTMAAAFGVQSSRNRERDFSQGSIASFIIAGVVFTVLFVVVVALIVKAVLASNGL